MRLSTRAALLFVFLSRIWLATLGLTFVVGTPVSLAQGANVFHYYDAVGRLIETVGTDGSTVQYTYDAVGNILSVQRRAADSLSISGFVPASGDVGTTVTVYGSAFDVVPGANSVKLGATAVAVVSSTPTSCTFIVPAGATGGQISIANSKGSASSQSSFIVVATRSPTISGFSPKLGPSGVAITVSGANFQTTAVNNKVLFGQGVAGVSSATTTSLLTATPTGVRSGKITVSTLFGTAKSTDDFFAAPAGVLPTDVAITSRIQLDGPGLSFALPAGKKALYIFEGVVGRLASVGISPATFTPTGAILPISMFGPDGMKYGENSISTSGSLHLHSALENETHTLLLGGAASAVSGTLYLSSDIVDSIARGGSAKVFAPSRPGQAARYSFTAQAGQAAIFTLVGSTFSGGGSISLMRDLNAIVVQPRPFTTSTLRVPVLPASAVYTLLIDPAFAGVGSIEVGLQAVDEQSVIVDGPVKSLALSGNKLAGSYVFDAQANDMIGVGIGNQVTTPANAVVEYYLIAPNGTVIASTMLPEHPISSTLAAIASVAGKYTVRVMPRAPAEAKVDLTVSKEISKTIIIDGPQVSMASARHGQSAKLNFDGVQGQRMTVAAILGTTVPSNSIVAYSLIDSNGEVIFARDTSTEFSAELPALPSTGRYSIRAIPRSSALGAGGAVWLSSEPTTTPITTNGTLFTFNANRPGQSARYTFGLAAGQNILLSAHSRTFTKEVNASLYAPDGSVVWGAVLGNAAVAYEVPVTGTFTLLLRPPGAATGSISLSVTTPTDVSGTINLNGPATAVNMAFGQSGNYSFAGTAGAKLNVGLNGVAFTYSDPAATRDVHVSVYKPDGTQLDAKIFSAGDITYDLPTLPVTGTYKVRIRGAGRTAYSIKGNLWLSSDLIGPITPDGTAKVFSSDRPGQNAAFTFTSPANTSYTLSLSGNTFSGGQVRVVNSSGATQGVATAIISSGTTFTSGLAGTYFVIVDPSGAATGSVTISLVAIGRLTGALALDGAPLAVNLPPGRGGTYSATVSGAMYLNVGLEYVSGNGTYWRNTSGVWRWDAGSNSIYRSGAAGTIDLLLDAESGNASALNLRVLLSTTYIGTITPNGAAVVLSTARAGQGARYTFNANAGQTVRLTVSGNTFSAGRAVVQNAHMLNVVSGQLTNGTFSSSPLTVSGVHTLILDPDQFAKGTATVAISIN